MPALAPASIVRLQSVMRPSMSIASTALPAYSIALPAPPDMPIFAMIASARSLALTPLASAPSTTMRIARGGRTHSVCVASTCFTCEAPMPNASAPKAPLVQVCESEPTMTMPGCAMPSSGATTCMMPCCG